MSLLCTSVCSNKLVNYKILLTLTGKNAAQYEKEYKRTFKTRFSLLPVMSIKQQFCNLMKYNDSYDHSYIIRPDTSDEYNKTN